MKVGVVVDNELNNDKRVLREISILKEHGYEISVLCLGFGKEYISPLDGINIVRINISKKTKDILFFFLNTIPIYEWLWAVRIKKFIDSNKIDLLHVHDLYMSRASAWGIKKYGKKIPMILDLHENYPYAVGTYRWATGIFRSIIARPSKWIKKEKQYLGFPDKIIVLSENYRNQLIKKYPYIQESRFGVFPNYPDLSFMSSPKLSEVKFPFVKSAPIIFYFGVVAERRGIFNALKAFETVISKGHDANFLIIGPIDKADRNKFNAISASPVLTKRVIYIPWIDLSELPAYLELSDICIAPFVKNPQHESGIANKIFDYMLGSKPLIVSDCQPQRDLIEKTNCGIVFSNCYDLIEAMIKLLNDSNLRQNMGKNGYNAIIKDYHLGNIKENLLSVYRECI